MIATQLRHGLCILALSLLLPACAHHHHGAEPMSESPTLNLALNNGQKWHMDKHTRTVLASMKRKADTVSAENATLDERQSLGAVLNKDLETLINGCTMEGDAHNALHEFLVPFMPAVQELEKTGDQHALTQTQDLLSAYTNFFH